MRDVHRRFCTLLLFIYSGNETKDGDIRLVGGEHLWQGRLEIFLSGSWGSIMKYYSRDSHESRVACRQLGYDPHSKLYAHKSSSSLNTELDHYLNCV